MREDLNRASELLSHCLVEEEGAALRSTKRRRLSMLLSVSLQAALLGAALLIPILVNGEKLQATVFLAPGIPWPKGDPKADQTERGSATPNQGPRRPQPIQIVEPRFIPPHPALNDPPAESGPIGDGVGGRRGVPGGIESLDLDVFTRAIPPPPAPPAPAPPQPSRIRISDLEPGMLIHRVDPAYPVLARQIRLEGSVILRAVIGRDGLVHELEVLSGHPFFISNTLDAVRQWRYRPTLLNSQPVEVETQITVIFTMRKQ